MLVMDWPLIHLAKSNFTLGQFLLSLAGCGLIALVGLLTILYPQTTYEWLVFKCGRDEMRRASPERGRFQLRAHQSFGAMMFLGGIFFIAILILSR
jgi:hypothetical protein